MSSKTGVSPRSSRGQESGFSIESWEQAEFLMVQVADLSAARAKKQAALDAEIAQTRARHDEALQRLDFRLSTLNSQLEDFSAAHRSEFKAAPDGDGRSYEHAGVTIGFRKLLDKVSLPRGDAKKEVSLEYLEQYRPEFVRHTPEFDLIALLPALKEGPPELVKALAEHGVTLKVGKDEFFLKVKSEG